jgi:hypothetical protein
MKNSNEILAASIREWKERVAADVLNSHRPELTTLDTDFTTDNLVVKGYEIYSPRWTEELIQYNNHVAPAPKVHWAAAVLFGAAALIKRNPTVERRALWGWLWR